MCAGQNPAHGSTAADRAAVGVHFYGNELQLREKARGGGQESSGI